VNENTFMDVRPNRVFIALQDFSIRSGIPIETLNLLTSEGLLDHVVVSGVKYLSWDRRGTEVSPLDAHAWVEGLYRADIIDKKEKSREKRGTS
jgi:hypothetical protein